MPETENKPISRKKIVEYLKSNRYLYSTGRNSMADILLIGGIFCGDFDES